MCIIVNDIICTFAARDQVGYRGVVGVRTLYIITYYIFSFYDLSLDAIFIRISYCIYVGKRLKESLYV